MCYWEHLGSSLGYMDSGIDCEQKNPKKSKKPSPSPKNNIWNKNKMLLGTY
jgi:hypothetical protein